MSTRVVNFRSLREPWPDDHIYIGRSGYGLDGYFGSPFVLQLGSSYKAHAELRGRVIVDTREQAINLYRHYFFARLESEPEFRRRILELKNKVLVCFCAPKPCHGDVIAEWVDAQ